MCTLCFCNSAYGNPPSLCMFTLGSFRFDAMLTLPILRLREEEEKYFFEQKKKENKISYGSICFACRSTLGTIGNQRSSTLSRAVVKIEIKKKSKKNKKRNVPFVSRGEILPSILHVVFLDVCQYVTEHFQVTVGLIDVL